MGLHLFSRSVHPELFETCATRELERDEYRLRLQITTAGHLITFQDNRVLFTEVCSGIHQALPGAGRLISETIDHAHSLEHHLLDRLHWESQCQIETVDPRIFLTIQQQLDKQQDFEGLVHRFASNGRIPMGGVSYIHVQAFQLHVLIKAFHTFPDTCSVVKCETKFSIVSRE